MNYLGHLYFSKGKLDLMVANLFGDFVKGKDYSYLPLLIQEGVLLHRQIDDYVDHHPVVAELRLELYTELPKIAGIAIDLYFDHLLAKNWELYHKQDFNEFVNEFLDYIKNLQNLNFINHDFKYPAEFINLLNAIRKYDFLKKYVHIDGLKMASEGLSRRVSFKNNLNEATEVYLRNEKKIENAFYIYMKDAKTKFKTE